MNPYNLLELVGRGVLGETFRARDTRRGRTVLIERLPDEFRQDADRRARFLQDARRLTVLSHPNIAILYEVGEQESGPYVAYEFVTGQSVRQMSGGQPLPVRVALDLAAQVVDALAEVHAHEIVHGGLAPDNIVVTAKGRVKLLEVGLTHWRPARSDAYLAPEQRRGGAADPRSDLFAAGAVLYEMLTGQPPVPGGLSSPAVAIAAGRRVVPKVSQEIERVVARALAENPESRYSSAAELAGALRAAAPVEDPQQLVQLPTSGNPRSGASARVLPLFVTAAAVAGVLLWLRRC